MGVNPTPEDMARVVSFLASKNSGFITGKSCGHVLHPLVADEHSRVGQSVSVMCYIRPHN